MGLIFVICAGPSVLFLCGHPNPGLAAWAIQLPGLRPWVSQASGKLYCRAFGPGFRKPQGNYTAGPSALGF